VEPHDKRSNPIVGTEDKMKTWELLKELDSIMIAGKQDYRPVQSRLNNCLARLNKLIRKIEDAHINENKTNS
jgi:hypothetical protein